MAKPERKNSAALLVLAIASVLAAILTLIPHSSAPEPSILGYKALCPFAPVSTLLCLVLAGVACVTRRRPPAQSQ